MEPRRAPVHDPAPRARHRPLAQVANIALPARREAINDPSARARHTGGSDEQVRSCAFAGHRRPPSGKPLPGLPTRHPPSRTDQASTALAEHYRPGASDIFATASERPIGADGAVPGLAHARPGHARSTRQNQSSDWGRTALSPATAGRSLSAGIGGPQDRPPRSAATTCQVPDRFLALACAD